VYNDVSYINVHSIFFNSSLKFLDQFLLKIIKKLIKKFITNGVSYFGRVKFGMIDENYTRI
jgi:hypothetical protein